MSLAMIDATVITDAVLGFLRAEDENGDTVTPAADLSNDDTSVVGVILIGDGEAPDVEEGHPTQWAIDATTGQADPYLVVRQVPLGGAAGTTARGGYAGGTPSTRPILYQLSGVGPSRRSAQRLATTAAYRLIDQASDLADLGQHVISMAERYGDGFDDRIGAVHQWTELVALDVGYQAT